MGQAAGTAAAIAVRMGCPPRAIPVQELQRTLVRQGAFLGPRFAAQG
ncbi:MAG: FAD-dependent oxidoreductase [Chloroflexi bacterium]|nr:FAD-dependent oxidoreductase [Chloroflexota bacterium]